MILSVVVFPSAEKYYISKQYSSPKRTTSIPAQIESTTAKIPEIISAGESNNSLIHNEDTTMQPVIQPEDSADPTDTTLTAEEETKIKSENVILKKSPEIESQNAISDKTETLDTVYPLSFETDYPAILSSVDERHIYTFSVKERGYIHYTINHAELHNLVGWEATLYKEYYLNGVEGEIGYRPLNLLKTTAVDTTNASPSIGLIPGKYRIVVKAVSGMQEEEYKLNAVFTPATNHEIECNDTKAAYTELYTDVPMIGSASCYADHQDDDWYLLRIRKNGKAQITFSHEKSDSVSVAWRIVLYDENGTELYAENSGLYTDTLDSGELGLREGVYFIAVLCRTRCDADYTLTVTASADDMFERENNDSFDTADSLPLGGMINGCVTAKAGSLDRDYYRFEMTARGNFALVFSHAPAALETDKNGWSVRLLTNTGEVMYSLISTWNATADRMPVLGLEAGVYYVEISSEDMYRSNLTYTLVAGYNESTGFEMEPNNSLETANPVAQGVPVTGTIVNTTGPDDDYFIFTVSAYSRVTVTLQHDQTESARDIFSFSVCDDKGNKAPVYSGAQTLKDDKGNEVFFINSLGNQPEVSGHFALQPGTYYIKVTSGRFFDSINYTVTYYLN